MPAVLEIAGVQEHLPVDGQSIMGLIDGRDTAEPHVFSEYHSNGVYSTCFMVRRGWTKYILIQGQQDQPFNLQKRSRTIPVGGEKELNTFGGCRTLGK